MLKTPKEKTYTVLIERNGETIKKRTKDIQKTIMESKPELLHTEVYITVSYGAGKDKQVSERKLNLIQGRRLYLIDTMMEVFINNLLLQ